MIAGGEVDAGVLACSQSIGIIDEIKPVADVIGDMVREAAAVRDRMMA
jgi:NAD(P)H-dependent flavin oxidoreductase YrpB (nitropropane dioxygenase family)